MEHFTPKYRRNPNEKIHSLYSGVAQGNQTVTTIVRPSLDRNRMEATKVHGPGLPRGQGGRIAVLVLGGMETTLDEMEYITAAAQDKKFIPQRGPGEIASMCRLLLNRRNEQIDAARKRRLANPSEAPRKRPVRLYLPVGYRMIPTSEPGLKMAVRV